MQTLILVDKDDKILGYEEKEKCHQGKGLHHRAFVVLLSNEKSEVLLQKRKHQRFDGLWDLTAVSHVLHLENHDESYEEAARRALKEEVGIDQSVSFTKTGGFNYFAEDKKQCENEYCTVLLGEYDGKIKTNKNVVYEYQWIKKEDFLKDINNNSKKYTPWAVLASEIIKDSLKKEPKMPIHIAFIMDGNRRWARSKKLPLMIGHDRGYRRIETIVNHAIKLGIGCVSFWAFSTENWNRDKKEVEYLMKIFKNFFKSSMINRLKKKNIRIRTMGDVSKFPYDIPENIRKIEKDTENNTSIIVNIGLNYGGRDEILRAVNKMIKKKKPIDEKTFSKYLDTKDLPDPELIVRTGGEQRLSGFLPWQGVYSELYFTKVFWPDFDEKEFNKAIEDFKARERRFGK